MIENSPKVPTDKIVFRVQYFYAASTQNVIMKINVFELRQNTSCSFMVLLCELTTQVALIDQLTEYWSSITKVMGSTPVQVGFVFSTALVWHHCYDLTIFIETFQTTS